MNFIAGYVENFHKPANKVILLHVIENLGIQDMSKWSHCAHSVTRIVDHTGPCWVARLQATAIHIKVTHPQDYIHVYCQCVTAEPWPYTYCRTKSLIRGNIHISVATMRITYIWLSVRNGSFRLKKKYMYAKLIY